MACITAEMSPCMKTKLDDQTKCGHVMACLNNFVLGLLIGKLKFRLSLLRQTYFAAFPSQALALLTRL